MSTKKVKANYTVRPELKEEFDKMADKNSLNRSSWLEKRMEEYIKENGG